MHLDAFGQFRGWLARCFGGVVRRLRVGHQPAPVSLVDPGRSRRRAEARASFDEFMVGRWKALTRTAYLLTGNRHDARDLLQSARWRSVVLLAPSNDTLEDRANWIYGVCCAKPATIRSWR